MNEDEEENKEKNKYVHNKQNRSEKVKNMRNEMIVIKKKVTSKKIVKTDKNRRRQMEGKAQARRR